MLIRNICPTGGARVIDATGDEVAAGDVVDVPDELAGHPPVGDDDPGAGLLAQSAVWELVPAPKPATPEPTPEPAPGPDANAAATGGESEE